MSDTSKMNNRELAEWCIAEYEAIDPEVPAEYRVEVWIAVRLAREVLRTADRDALRAALEWVAACDRDECECAGIARAALDGEVSDE